MESNHVYFALWQLEENTKFCEYGKETGEDKKGKLKKEGSQNREREQKNL